MALDPIVEELEVVKVVGSPTQVVVMEPAMQSFHRLDDGAHGD